VTHAMLRRLINCRFIIIIIIKRMNLQHFGSDLADIRIRMKPEIWIQMLDHRLGRVCALIIIYIIKKTCWMTINLEHH